jgi:LPS export ABC transporter protein LptC
MIKSGSLPSGKKLWPVNGPDNSLYIEREFPLMKIKNNILLCLGFLLFTGAILNACRNRIEDVHALTYRDTFPIESAKDVEMVYSDSAVIKALVKSPVVNRYAGDDPFIIMPKGLTVFFYDSAMRVKTKLTAHYAVKYEKSDHMEVRNDVVVVNHLGEKLNTEHLVWDQKSRSIYSDVFVKITQVDKVVYGEGMDADESFDKWVIRKPKGHFFINMDEETGTDKPAENN